MAEEAMKSLVGKLKEALIAVVLDWFDKVFPPETREEKIKHWLHVALPFLIVAVVVSLFNCCSGCSGGRRGGGRVKMMKAPGGGGNSWIPRKSFESNPKGYFRDHRRR